MLPIPQLDAQKRRAASGTEAQVENLQGEVADLRGLDLRRSVFIVFLKTRQSPSPTGDLPGSGLRIDACGACEML